MPPFTPAKFRDPTKPKGPLGLKAPTGSTGAPGRDALTVKQGLRRLGRLQPPAFPDGIRRLNEHPDRETVAGIRSFQKTHGLKPDGSLNPGGPTERTLAAALGKGPKAAAAKARRALPKGPVGTGIKAAQPDVDALTEALAVTGNTLSEDTETPTDRADTIRYAIQDFQRDFPGQLTRDGIALPGGPTLTKLDRQLALMETGDREAQADGILLAAETGPFRETVQTGDDTFTERNNPGTVDDISGADDSGGDGADTLTVGSGDDTGEATGGDQPNAVTDGNEEDGFLPSPQEAADAVNSMLDSAEDKLSQLDPELAREGREVLEKVAGGAYGFATSIVGSVEDTVDLASDIYNAGMYWATGDEEHREGAENLESLKDGLATLIDNPEAIPEAIREDIETRKAAADALSEEGKHFEAAAAYSELGTDYLSVAIPAGGVVLKSGSAAKGAARIGKVIADKVEGHLKLELSSGDAKPGQGIGGRSLKGFRGNFISEAEYHAFTERVKSGVPLGFESKAQVDEAISVTRDSLNNMGLDPAKAQIGIIGSAVTGRKFDPDKGPTGKYSGPLFGQRGGGKNSDHDYFIASEELFRKAQDLGIDLRGEGSRTAKLSSKQLKQLGLKLPKNLGYDNSIVIYKNRDSLWKRGPHILLEKGTKQ